MKPVRTLAHPWMLALTLSAVATGLLEGQGTEVSFSAGSQFSDRDLDRFASRRGRLELAIERPLRGRLVVRGGLAGSEIGPPPCPAPPESQTRWKIEPGRSVEGQLDLGLPVTIGRAFSLEPYAGAGVRYLTSAQTDDPSPDAYGLSSSARMLVSGGATASVGVTTRLRAFTRLRLSRHFMGSQTLTPMGGEPFQVELRDLDTVSLTAGVALRF